MSWFRRLSNTLRPGRLRRDIERELAFHVSERADELRSEGLSDDEAIRRARIQLGNRSLYEERTRDADVSGFVDALLRNARYSLRALARTPGFTAAVISTLALGIGANSAVFSALDAVLLDELPFPNGERLVLVRQVFETETNVAPVRLEDWDRLSSSFEALTGYYVEDVSDTTGDLPERVRRAVVAPRFLEVWGISPALGDGLDRSPGEAALLVSDRYWRERLGADPNALDRTVRIEGRSYRIGGVLPASFLFPVRDVDLWWPTPVDSPWVENRPSNRKLQWYTGVGRLAPGITLEQARADLSLVQARLGEEYPETDADIGVQLVPLKEILVGSVRGSLWLLFGAVSVLLLIACTNVAALMLARAARREEEIALRFSLGASRPAVAVQLLTETGILTFVGAALGLLLAAGAPSVFRSLAPELPRLDEVAVDGRILLYTTACALVVALLCGLVPAVRIAGGARSLSRSGRTQTSPRASFQWILVGAQVAMSVALLALAGLLLRSFEELSRVDPGFDPAGVLTFRVSGNWAETQDRGRLRGRIERTIEELRALPEIEAVATAWKLPGVPGGYQTEFELVEGRSETEPPLVAEWRSGSPDYWRTMRIPLLAGERCRGPELAILVNRSFVDRYFPERSVVGLRLSWENGSLSGPILGVVQNARELGIDEAPVPTVYSCDAAPNPFPWLLVRTSGDPLAPVGAIRAKLKEIEPLRSVFDVAPLEERIGDAYAQNRLRTVLLLFFSVTALALACLGVYGTLSYVVSLRRREVGLRLALGALRRDIVGEIVARALRVVGPACAVGLLLSIAFRRAVSGMLYGVSPSEPGVLGTAVFVVLAVAVLAAFVPALRAARVEPMRVLRQE